MIGVIHKMRATDERAFRALAFHRHSGVARVMRVLTHLGGTASVIVIAALMTLAPEPAVAAAGWHAGWVLALSHIWVQLLKRTISRSRPSLAAGSAALIEAPDRFSFPSGHAAAALSVGLSVAAILPGVPGAAVLVLSLTVGLSRCCLGVHYPGDVLVGWLLAIAAEAVVSAALF
jgi:undecaprenyl-diphosphatase